MNVVDSSAWLEYFAGTAAAAPFAKAIEDVERLIVPSISIVEVFKKVLSVRTEHEAFQAISLMQQGQIAPLNLPLSLEAARLGQLHRLPLADSIIFATAVNYDATLWTQDANFENLPGVKFFAKKNR